jgi:hypothetical protein
MAKTYAYDFLSGRYSPWAAHHHGRRHRFAYDEIDARYQAILINETAVEGNMARSFKNYIRDI